MKKEELAGKFEQFNHLTILIIGDVMIDSYLWGNVERISPEAPVPIVTGTKQENRLGGAANVALNILALGAIPVLCSVIGNDENGRLFFDLLEKSSLINEGILTDELRMTTKKTRIISSNQHLLRVDQEKTNNLTADLEVKFTEKIHSILKNRKIDSIIFEDYDKGVITPYIINQIVELANNYRIPTLVDPKKRNFMAYHHVTLFKPNFKELMEGLKLDIEKGDFGKLYDAAWQLHTNSVIKYIFITLSEMGVFISDQENYFNVPAEVRDIADVSGAGDTVISVASVCLALNFAARDIATIANLAGGLVCEKVGVVPVDKMQLLEECIRYYSI
jgi:rfaE bifunctional protein kinase chain/domain